MAGFLVIAHLITANHHIIGIRLCCENWRDGNLTLSYFALSMSQDSFVGMKASKRCQQLLEIPLSYWESSNNIPYFGVAVTID
ncbi:predicted protein [Coccidioides posadasii str. Silveira]|uniref:Predicted protein n=1 Tax=Coccidioides posadasii (strain RMSCC 757 / Silveira) TaxID=443226 RepID=E9D332_COCPS|nr:predicted protein [Coccidioides posadasii str. Silveira]